MLGMGGGHGGKIYAGFGGMSSRSFGVYRRWLSTYIWHRQCGVNTPANVELQQCGEFFYRKIGLSDNCSEGTTIQFLVIGHNHLTKRISPAENDMAPFLPSNYESYSLQRLDACTPRDARQFAHTAMRTASKCSSGTGRLSSFKAAI